MNRSYEKLLKCLKQVRERTDFVPLVALVLGSGLGAFSKNVETVCEVMYSDIEGFPASTVSGHAGKLIFGYAADVPVVIMDGRVHYYEGYDVKDVVLPVRLMGLLGAKALILTNAAGGMGDDMNPGDFMLITDQISSLVPSPLVGENIEELGTRFPDMSRIYDEELCKIIREAAKKAGISSSPALCEGVYIQTSGPQYESPAEIRMYKALGVGAVGMSTAVEAIAARHMGMRVCGISCITNLASGISDHALSHEEVKKAGDAAAPYFEKLIKYTVSDIGKIL